MIAAGKFSLLNLPGLSATPFVLSSVEAQPFDGAQGERDSWLIRARSIAPQLSEGSAHV